jgi:hypothetical protein
MYKRICIFVMLLFLLPSVGRAEVLFCFPFDIDTKTCSGNPSRWYSVNNTGIDVSDYKYGSGSAGNLDHAADPSGFSWILSLPVGVGLSETGPGDTGTIEVWVKQDVISTNINDIFFYNTWDENTNSMVTLQYMARIIGGQNKWRFTLTMLDSSGGSVIYYISTAAWAIYPNNDPLAWHHIALSWAWNDASGYTKLFHDGNEIYSSTNGNTKTRNSETDYFDIRGHVYYTDASNGYPRADDLTIDSEAKYSSSFQVPTAVQCVCAPNIVLNFGRPGGWGFGYGFGN